MENNLKFDEEKILKENADFLRLSLELEKLEIVNAKDYGESLPKLAPGNPEVKVTYKSIE